MNIIEAIKSGKRFKIPGKTAWYSQETESDEFDYVDLIADDWAIEKIEEEKKELSWDQIADAISRFDSNDDYIDLSLVKKELEFKR